MVVVVVGGEDAKAHSKLESIVINRERWSLPRGCSVYCI